MTPPVLFCIRVRREGNVVRGGGEGGAGVHGRRTGDGGPLTGRHVAVGPDRAEVGAMYRGRALQQRLRGRGAVPGECHGWAARWHGRGRVGDEAVVSVHGRGHRGMVHRLEAGALALGAQSQGSSQGTSSVLVICQPQSDDTEDDNDDRNKGHHTTHNSYDERVHVGELGRLVLVGLSGGAGQALRGSPRGRRLWSPDDVLLRGRLGADGGVDHLGSSRRRASLASEVGLRNSR